MTHSVSSLTVAPPATATPRQCLGIAGAFSPEREAYEVVQAAYDRAVTLCRTQEINEIWPALREAKLRMLAAEVRQ